ncbi:MAG: addiction module HigA family antidote [Planctomycetota bacterium]
MTGKVSIVFALTINGEFVLNGPQMDLVWSRLSTITERKIDMSRSPIHPGLILGEELEEIGISAAELARQLKIPANRITQIIAGRRNITADTALRLGKWFGTSAVFWLNLQKSYELRVAQKEIGKELNKIPTRNHNTVHA